MRVISGFISIVESRAHIMRRFVAYGEPDNPFSYSQSLLSNGLKPFESKIKAHESVIELFDFERADARKIHVAYLRLVIAETKDDLKEFSNSRRLIVIGVDHALPGYSQYDLYGSARSPKERDLPLTGASLSATGFRTFKAFNDAMMFWQEYTRQVQSPAMIAHMTLHRIESHARPFE